MTGAAMEQMYRLLAIAKYSDRYVIPTAHREQAHNLEEIGCSVDFDDDPSTRGVFGESSGRVVPVAVESFAAAKARREEAARG
jgi:nitrate reductase beta subunit